MSFNKVSIQIAGGGGSGKGSGICEIMEINNMSTVRCDVSGIEFQSKNGWISVKDKLPENKQIVLVVDEFGDMSVCRADITNLDYMFILKDTSHQTTNVKFWRRLPELPE